jgi:LDH2 family malate/lactate/ureidoglycolate dehydrogenase
MATTVAARAKIHRAQERREPIPLGWALDEMGAPTTDPDAALKGTLLPIGGPKGYGLALMIDVLAGMLSGSKYGPDVGRLYQMIGPLGAGFLSIAIDVERFMPLHQFKRLMKSYTESIRKGKKGKGTSRIYLPGEIEYEKEQVSLTEGIEINSKVVAGLNKLLEKFKSTIRLAEE